MFDRVARQIKREVFWYGSFQLPVASDLAMSFFFQRGPEKKKNFRTSHCEASHLQVLDMFVRRQRVGHQMKTVHRHPRKSLKFFFRKLHHCRARAFCKTSRVNSQGSPGFHELVTVRVELFPAGTMTMSHNLWLRRPRGDVSDRKRPSCSVSVTTEHPPPAPQSVSGAILNIAIPERSWPMTLDIVWHRHSVGP